MTTASAVLSELCSGLATTETARLKPLQGGVPTAAGIYAWWSTSPDALPSLPPAAVDGVEAWLLYIGIAPSRPGSRQTLRGRVCGNHLRGNVSGSTFRLSLAALLWEQEGWPPSRRGSRALLSPQGNQALSTWQADHLRVSWAKCAAPWEAERAIIKQLGPPLNLAQNRSHPFSWTLSEARQRFRSAAMSSSAV